MALYWRIWAAVMLMTLLVLGVFVALATLQFGGINATLVGERLIVLADRTVAPFSASVRLGLPLSSVRNATALLERARQTDEDIVALHVFDAKGQVVSSTAAAAPTTIPAAALNARASARGSPWYRETIDGFIASVDITARGGASAGGILVVYPSAGSQTQVRAMLAELALGAIGAWLAAACAGALLLRWGLAGLIRHFDALDGDYRDFARDGWRRAAGHDEVASPADARGLRAQLEVAAAGYRDTGRRLASLSRDAR